ncbi:MAG: hypothetical protein K8I00_10650, partial [Candidatus Omnitrophica bacterium]|nr:hypothetical protein [Candidatus Omnitrophota bacterium]
EEIRDSQKSARQTEDQSIPESQPSGDTTDEVISGADDGVEQNDVQAAPQGDESTSPPAEDKTEETVGPDEDPMSSKLLNDTVAFIKSIATERGRNVEWAVKSVAQSDSITNDEALAKDVIEFIAKDVPDLLRQLDGHKIRLNGKSVALQTTQLNVIDIPMDTRQSFLNILANPNIAYFLMILGFYGLLFEITHPGIGAPGIIGAIFLILAFYSLQTLPTNYAGVALVMMGLVLFIAEAYTPTFGLLTLGGAVCLVLGSVLLFDTADPVMRVSKTLIGVLVLSTSAISIFLLSFLLRAQRNTPMGGVHRLIGQKGEVQRAIEPGKEGKVFVSGELWNAIAEERLNVGDKVLVDSVEQGMLVKVRKLN